jgi:SAM-dependent methyltransferase
VVPLPLNRHQQDLDARSAALVDPQTGVWDLFALAYQDLHLRNPEVFSYNWYRFGLPRHLAALAALEWAPTSGPVLDVGCGAGHLTWALTEHTDAPVIGVDGLFFALYVAKTRIAPAADFVCGELESLPLADGTAGGIWASDVLHAVNRKVQVARELARVATEGSWGAVVGLAVAGHDHEYPGRPLSLEGYRRLLPDDATLVPDDALVDGYLKGRAASRADPGEGRTVTALWGDGNDGAPFTDWPHGRGERAVHTLLRPDGDTLRLTFPTASFEREHGALRRYTPAEAEVPHAPSPEEAERLVETFVLLGFPPGYQPGA